MALCRPSNGHIGLLSVGPAKRAQHTGYYMTGPAADTASPRFDAKNHVSCRWSPVKDNSNIPGMRFRVGPGSLRIRGYAENPGSATRGIPLGQRWRRASIRFLLLGQASGQYTHILRKRRKKKKKKPIKQSGKEVCLFSK